MSKNYVKMLGWSFVVGMVISKIYDLGVNEGKCQLATELTDTLEEVTQAVKNLEE